MKFSYNTIESNIDMENVMKVNYYKIGVILDTDCSNSHIIYKQFTAANLPFNQSYAWLFITTASEIPAKSHSDLPLTIDSELTLVLMETPTYTLYDVYNHGYRHGGKLNITLMGYWNEHEGLQNHLTQYKYKSRQDFHGMSLNFSCIIMNKPSYMDLETYLTTPIDPHFDSMTRFSYILIRQLRDMYNFNINLMRSNTWGYRMNGTYNGIIGDMVNGVVDVSVTPFQYIANRLDACEHTTEIWTVRPYIMFRHPKKSNIRNPFLKPFTQTIWWIVLSFSVIYWTLLFLDVKVEQYYRSAENHHIYTDTSSEIALIMVAAVSQQGFSEGPNLYSGRLICITLLIWAVLMYQFYSASIVSSLLAAPPKFINTLQDFSNSDLRSACENIPYTVAYFKYTTDPVSREFWEKKLKPGPKREPYITAEEGLREVSKGGFGFFIDSATGYKIIEDTFTQEAICDLTEIGIVPPRPVSIITSKNSPFKKMINYGLRKMVESGLTSRLTKIWHHRRPQCPESFRSKPVPVELKEFGPALFILLAGSFLSVGMLAAELVMARMQQRRRRLLGELGDTASPGLDDGQLAPVE